MPRNEYRPNSGSSPPATRPFLYAPDTSLAARPSAVGLLDGDAPPLPRVWTALAVGLVTIPLALMVATSVLAVAAVWDGHREVILSTKEAVQRWTNEYSQTRVGLTVLVIPSQLVFLAMALGAAWVSPRPMLERLGLQRGLLPLWVWGVFILATPMIAILTPRFLFSLVTESEELRLMSGMVKAHTEGFFWGLTLVVAVLPGVTEELMYRGYVQTRLAERWHPAVAIIVSTLLFCVAHLDPVHAIGVAPLGLWLGAVAWRAGSVWPAIICHLVNNLVSVLGAKFQALAVGTAWDPATLTSLVISVPAFLFALYVFRSG